MLQQRQINQQGDLCITPELHYDFGIIRVLAYTFLTQGKLQRGLLLCIKLYHVVIQAALVQYCNSTHFSIRHRRTDERTHGRTDNVQIFVLLWLLMGLCETIIIFQNFIKYHQAAIVPPGCTCTCRKFWNTGMILFVQSM